jgi:hypothetical protein
MIQERLDNGWTFRGVIPHGLGAASFLVDMVHLVYVKRVRS